MKYTVVHIIYPPNTFPNKKLEQILLTKIDLYIKQRVCTMADSWGHLGTTQTDYRYSAWSNRAEWRDGVDQNFFRIFLDDSAAHDFIKLNHACGAKVARVVTEDDIGKSLNPTVKFPSIEHVSNFLWKKD